MLQYTGELESLRLNRVEYLENSKLIFFSRLNKTWSCLARRERQVFEKLAELFSEKDNFARLREHMDSIALKHQV